MSYHEKEITMTQTIPVVKLSDYREKRIQTAHLLLIKSPHPEKTQRLYSLKGPMILGRKESADIALDDPKLSRHHAQIYTDGKYYYIKDLNSTNGTKVNGEVIKEKRIYQKDSIEIGDCHFEFNVPSLIPYRKEKATSSPRFSLRFSKMISFVKTIFFATLILFSLILLYTSATRPFKTIRTPQSISVSSDQAQSRVRLFYEIASQAYTEADYEKARHFVQEARNLDTKRWESERLDRLDQSIDQALVLKQVYLEKQKSREEKYKILSQVQFYFDVAQKFVEMGELDRAVITYQEALMTDPDNEEIKKAILNIDQLKSKPVASQKVSEKLSTLEIYQQVESFMKKAKKLLEEENYIGAIESYQKALQIAKQHNFQVTKVAAPLMEAINEFKSKTKALWVEVDTLSQAQKYNEAKEKVIQLLKINPNFEPASLKLKEFNSLLEKQAKHLYSQAVMYEALPDIEAAKEKWESILSLLTPEDSYYQKAQKKLTYYASF
ncbi:MAG: FHA domain-containing protein [Deltaproteobacteria bacterium]|nr:FHA domain-containing protein [Deltaproteobacteria bacterium]